MANVTGQIGDQGVVLENAATEATLRLLLECCKANSSKEALAQMAKKVGLDPDVIQEAHKGLSLVGLAGVGVGKAFQAVGFAAGLIVKHFAAVTEFATKLTAGTAQTSDLFGALSKLPFGIGVVASGFQILAKYQEAALKSYQELTNSGVNFGGSLSKLRMAASESYLTLDQFTKLMKGNSETFARMGGNVNEGAEAFSKMSKSLIHSDAGTYLLNLGYTTEQVNQSMASYIAMSGGRTAQEMKNTTAIIDSSAAYMEQLNGLAKLTGKQREQQEEALKKQAMNAAWQSALAKMDEKERLSATKGMAYAMSVGGTNAAEAFQSEVMKVPPITKGAQQWSALYAETAEGIRKSARGVTDINFKEADQRKLFFDNRETQLKEGDRLGDQLNYVLSASGGAMAENVQVVGQLNNITRSQTRAQAEAALETEKNQKTEAAAAVERQKKMFEAGQKLLDALIKVSDRFVPIMGQFVNLLVDGVTWLTQHTEQIKELITSGISLVKTLWEFKEIILAVIVALTAFKLVSMGATAARAIGGLLSVGTAATAATAAAPAVAAVAATAAGASAAALALGALTAGAVGYGVGTLLNKTFGISDKIVDFLRSDDETAMAKRLTEPTYINRIKKESPAEKAAASTASKSSETTSTEDTIEKLRVEMHQLNIQTTDMLKIMRDVSDNTKDSVEATRSLDPNLW